MQGFSALIPFQDVWDLGVGDESLDTDLLPLERTTIREGTCSRNSATVETIFEWGHVVNGDDPPHPAAAHIGASTHCLAERCLFGSRVFKYLDNSEVLAIFHREKDVTRPEARMNATIDPVDTEHLGDLIGGSMESFRTYSIRNMIQAHVPQHDMRSQRRSKCVTLCGLFTVISDIY